MREFASGATRDNDQTKYDYEGFLSPKVIERFAKYMHLHRRQSDGSLRDSDNWQRGIPIEQYVKSLFRHFHDVWNWNRGAKTINIEEALCAVLFNAQGILFELLKEKEKENDRTTSSDSDKRPALRCNEEIEREKRFNIHYPTVKRHFACRACEEGLQEMLSRNS